VKLRSAAIAHYCTAGATIFLVGVGIWGVIETKHALKLSQRAWLAPVGAYLTFPLEKGKPIRFVVLTSNSGHELLTRPI